MTTRPVSYLKAHLAEEIHRVQESHDPVTITQNGVPTAVLQDHESYQRTRQALAMLKLIAMGEHDIAHGRTVSQDEVLRRIRSRASEGDRPRRRRGPRS